MPGRREPVLAHVLFVEPEPYVGGLHISYAVKGIAERGSWSISGTVELST